jgi:hypothetical protein
MLESKYFSRALKACASDSNYIHDGEFNFFQDNRIHSTVIDAFCSCMRASVRARKGMYREWKSEIINFNSALFPFRAYCDIISSGSPQAKTSLLGMSIAMPVSSEGGKRDTVL